MAQPEFRRAITMRVRRLPQPIPAVWTLVDGLHYATDAAISLIERVHLKMLDAVARAAVTRFGVPAARAAQYQRRHSYLTARFYSAARVAHWYI